MAKLEQAAELKIPAALAVDSVRYSMTDADARWRWAAHVSGRMLASAFAVAWEWENTALVSELVEYHCARGTFAHEPLGESGGWDGGVTTAVLVDTAAEEALAAGGEPVERPDPDDAGPAAATADGPHRRPDPRALPDPGAQPLRPDGDVGRPGLDDVAMTAPAHHLVLRFADLGVATYGSLRVVGQPERTVTWVVEEPLVLAALEELQGALPEPHGGESLADALDRALTSGPFAAPERELTLAYILGVLLISGARLAAARRVRRRSAPAAVRVPERPAGPDPVGSARRALAGPSREELVSARTAAITTKGTTAARIPWQLADISTLTDGVRLMELVDVLMAVPPNIAHTERTPARWPQRRGAAPLLVLDPRVPGQRPDSPLGSVLGRPSAESRLSRHFATVMSHRPVLPGAGSAVDLFRRTDADRAWLAGLLHADSEPAVVRRPRQRCRPCPRLRRPRGDPPRLHLRGAGRRRTGR